MKINVVKYVVNDTARPKENRLPTPPEFRDSPGICRQIFKVFRLPELLCAKTVKSNNSKFDIKLDLHYYYYTVLGRYLILKFFTIMLFAKAVKCKVLLRCIIYLSIILCQFSLFFVFCLSPRISFYRAANPSRNPYSLKTNDLFHRCYATDKVKNRVNSLHRPARQADLN